MKKHLKFAFRIILILIISLTLGLGVYNFNAQNLSGNQLPMPLGFGVAVVVSGSMEPELSVNDVIIVTETKDYKVRDVVVFQDGNSLVVHRIIRIEGEGEDIKFITQGDANNSEDPAISLNEIKGEVIFSIPFVGSIVQFIKSLPGTILIVALAAFLYYKSIKKEREKDEEEASAVIEEITRLKGELTVSSAPCHSNSSAPCHSERREESQNLKDELKED